MNEEDGSTTTANNKMRTQDVLEKDEKDLLKLTKENPKLKIEEVVTIDNFIVRRREHENGDTNDSDDMFPPSMP